MSKPDPNNKGFAFGLVAGVAAVAYGLFKLMSKMPSSVLTIAAVALLVFVCFIRCCSNRGGGRVNTKREEEYSQMKIVKGVGLAAGVAALAYGIFKLMSKMPSSVLTIAVVALLVFVCFIRYRRAKRKREEEDSQMKIAIGVGLAAGVAAAGYGIFKLMSASALEEENIDDKKYMKPPGRPGHNPILRNVFEDNPTDYFRNLRGKK